MVTYGGNTLIRVMIQKSPADRDMDMAKAGEACGSGDNRSGKTKQVSVITATEQWQPENNRQRHRNENWKPVNAPGD